MGTPVPVPVAIPVPFAVRLGHHSVKVPTATQVVEVQIVAALGANHATLTTVPADLPPWALAAALTSFLGHDLWADFTPSGGISLVQLPKNGIAATCLLSRKIQVPVIAKNQGPVIDKHQVSALIPSRAMTALSMKPVIPPLRIPPDKKNDKPNLLIPDKKPDIRPEKPSSPPSIFSHVFPTTLNLSSAAAIPPLRVQASVLHPKIP